MDITLPELKNPDFLGLSACGNFLVEDGHATGFPNGFEDRFAFVSCGGRNAVFNVHFDLQGTEGHVHIDYVDRDFYPAEDADACEFDEIQEILSRLHDESLEVNATGGFRVDVSSLRENDIIRSFSQEVSAGDLSVQLSSGSLAVKGAPVERIDWSFNSNSNRAIIYIHCDAVTQTFDEGYLLRIEELVERQFLHFVKKDTTHADE